MSLYYYQDLTPLIASIEDLTAAVEAQTDFLSDMMVALTAGRSNLTDPIPVSEVI